MKGYWRLRVGSTRVLEVSRFYMGVPLNVLEGLGFRDSLKGYGT